MMSAHMASIPRVTTVATAVPPFSVAQDQVRTFARSLFGGVMPEIERMLEVFGNAGIDERHFSVPPEWFDRSWSFGEKNEVYGRAALDLAAQAAGRCLERAGLGPRDVDHVLFISTTGLSTPSIDAHLLNRMGFRTDVRRTPIWGLGCAGGAAGLSRAADFARARPKERILLIALELCGLTFQRNDVRRSNLVGTALFADGAAAALVNGSGEGPEVLDSRSVTWPDSLDVMGWEVNDEGLRVVFSRDIPSIVSELVRPAVVSFLGDHGLDLSDVRHLVAHPGGPKVMAAYRDSLGLSDHAMRHAREVLRTNGNMSSPTVLFVLERFLGDATVRRGDLGLLTALGPGFSTELVLLRF